LNGPTFKRIGALVAEIFPIWSLSATTLSSWSSVQGEVIYMLSGAFGALLNGFGFEKIGGQVPKILPIWSLPAKVSSA
jgi:hypothetical protein